MKHLFKKIAILLCIVFIAPAILSCIPTVNTVNKAEAAEKVTKAKLFNTKADIGISSSPEYISIDNQKASAKYTFTSSNKKVVTVSKYGEVTGVSAGKADITVKETYKGKTTKVGTYKVTVNNSKLQSKKIDIIALNSSTPFIMYSNYNAIYTLESSDESVVSVDEYGNMVGLKDGKATVTVSETYKKKTRSLGKVTVTVHASSINADTKSIEMGVNTSTDPQSVIYIDNQSWEATYSFESEDSTILSVSSTDDWGYTYYKITGMKLGTTNLTVYENYKGNKRAVGTVTVTVKDIPVTDIVLNSDYMDENGNLSLTYYLNSEYLPNLNEFIMKTPTNASTPITFTSSDETIVKVDTNGNVQPVSVGKAEVTATCGSFTAKLEIVVVDSTY